MIQNISDILKCFIYYMSNKLDITDIREIPKYYVTEIFELSDICLKGF